MPLMESRMTKKIATYFTIVAMGIAPAVGWAESQLYVPPPEPLNVSKPNPNPNAQNTINQGSNTGKASQEGGAGANAAAGAALIAAGVPMLAQPPTAPMGAMLIALGMMALAQSGHDSGAAGQSGNTGAASVYNQGDAKTQANQAEAEKGGSTFMTPEAKKAAAQIAEMGYKVDKTGIKLPDGSKISASSLSSPGAMAAAGIDPSVIAKLDEINKEMAQKYNVSSMPVAAGGGGGGGASAGAEDVGGGSGSGAEGVPGRNAWSMDANAQKGLIAGKTVSLDGEPIGVAGANIFDMIHTAYQKKRSGDQFMEVEEAMVRMPASIPRKNTK